MKTRDEQAEEYANAICAKVAFPELIDIYKAFQAGWDAALKSQWRDAREELPGKSDGYLVKLTNGCMDYSFWDSIDHEWQDYNSGYALDKNYLIVTHWMPIPDLP